MYYGLYFDKVDSNIALWNYCIKEVEYSKFFCIIFAYVKKIKIETRDQFSANLKSSTMQKSYAFQIELHSVKIVHCHHVYCAQWQTIFSSDIFPTRSTKKLTLVISSKNKMTLKNSVHILYVVTHISNNENSTEMKCTKCLVCKKSTKISIW